MFNYLILLPILIIAICGSFLIGIRVENYRWQRCFKQILSKPPYPSTMRDKRVSKAMIEELREEITQRENDWRGVLQQTRASQSATKIEQLQTKVRTIELIRVDQRNQIKQVQKTNALLQSQCRYKDNEIRHLQSRIRALKKPVIVSIEGCSDDFLKAALVESERRGILGYYVPGVLDQDILDHLEAKLIDEAWKKTIKDQFLKAIEEKFAVNLEIKDDKKFREFFDKTMKVAGGKWISNDRRKMKIDVNIIVDYVLFDVIKKWTV